MYGLAENIHNFRLGTNYTQTFYAVDAGNTIDGNVYGTIPFYQETRYGQNGSETTAHGMYARNGMSSERDQRNDILIVSSTRPGMAASREYHHLPDIGG